MYELQEETQFGNSTSQEMIIWHRPKKPHAFVRGTARYARAGNSICRSIQDPEFRILGKKGCIWGKARTDYYGVTPDQPIPADFLSK